eukprot:TRINITY_DN49656_c0_g1_i1.p1 TRINITY_DN49656_c0_g1~~TRINITY_DN49656_c0_g1_i1.p1  ORF type:complete len:354 (-),score=84.38 TRINITY_DN49656_c0_g1_i1:163-1224(-)
MHSAGPVLPAGQAFRAAWQQPARASSSASAVPNHSALTPSLGSDNRTLPAVAAAFSAGRAWRKRRTAAASMRQPVTKGEVSPAQPVPVGIVAPPYVAEPEKVRGWWNSRVAQKTPEDVEAMRAAGKLAHATLDLAAELIRPGVTTEEMDKQLHAFICDHGAYPSDLLYKGFPKSVMISINEVICHGIPDSRPLQEGDLVNVDVTLYLNGFHADTARTWVCGEGDEKGQRLVAATREALDAAVAVCRAGAPMKAIGDAVASIAEREGFGVVKSLVGHGIGEFFHGVPQVFHCRNSDNRKMQEGTTFTIEPVLTEGSPEWITWDDGWTVATSDGGRSAQFEHTLLITEGGCEVFT